MFIFRNTAVETQGAPIECYLLASDADRHGRLKAEAVSPRKPRGETVYPTCVSARGDTKRASERGVESSRELATESQRAKRCCDGVPVTGTAGAQSAVEDRVRKGDWDASRLLGVLIYIPEALTIPMSCWRSGGYFVAEEIFFRIEAADSACIRRHPGEFLQESRLSELRRSRCPDNQQRRGRREGRLRRSGRRKRPASSSLSRLRGVSAGREQHGHPR